MKTVSVRVVKKSRFKTNSQSPKVSKSDFVSPTAKIIKNNINNWVSELRVKKDLERIKSFNLLAEVNR